MKSARVKSVAALARKKDRLERGLFLVEGPQAVRELLTFRPSLVEVVYATTGDEAWQSDIDRLADAAQVEMVRVTDSVLAAMAQTVHPQGVVAVARIEEVSLTDAFRAAKLVAVLHEVRDPGNAGAVLRAADAAGADAVVFSGDSIDPWHPKVVRATTGSLFHLPVVTTKSLQEVVQALHEAGLVVLAADVHGRQLRAAEEVLSERVAWVFGNEARGLHEDERQMADHVLRLPIFGAAESLNLATAASVLLYQSAFARRAEVS